MNIALFNMYDKLKTLMLQEDGQDLVEYGLVISLVAVGIAAVLPTLRNDVIAVFTAIETSL
jgi:pilus assembly protein Flp/PilA